MSVLKNGRFSGVFYLSVDNKTMPPENRIARLANGARFRLIWDELF